MTPTLTLTDTAETQLTRATIGWLTTVRADHAPVSSPVWFVWSDGAVYIMSQPGAGKLRNVAANPHVSFHLDSDGYGGAIVTLEGTAELMESLPAPVEDAYFAKYEDTIRNRMGSTPEELRRSYSRVVRIVPNRIRAW